MNPLWPQTPKTLLTRIADLAEGEDEAEWARFVELYGPAIGRFIRLLDPDIPDADVDDMVQDTLVKLVSLLRGKAFDPQRAKFSTWLGTIVRRQMVDRMRRRKARNADSHVPLEDEMLSTADSDPAAMMDVAWRLARHQAAVRHVFAKSALSLQNRQIYLMATADGLSPKEIAQRLGIKENVVRAIRSRVAKMIEAVEGQFE
ncbi:MAG: sigma-70 family RNA polymerase sigma factor [Kiritimatiellae bacterium]|nr:sigma-70 family RNA polymerase sigma factor [Kiritimatiellia bacterium]